MALIVRLMNNTRILQSRGSGIEAGLILSLLTELVTLGKKYEEYRTTPHSKTCIVNYSHRLRSLSITHSWNHCRLLSLSNITEDSELH